MLHPRQLLVRFCTGSATENVRHAGNAIDIAENPCESCQKRIRHGIGCSGAAGQDCHLAVFARCVGATQGRPAYDNGDVSNSPHKTMMPDGLVFCASSAPECDLLATEPADGHEHEEISASVLPPLALALHR